MYNLLKAISLCVCLSNHVLTSVAKVTTTTHTLVILHAVQTPTLKIFPTDAPL